MTDAKAGPVPPRPEGLTTRVVVLALVLLALWPIVNFANDNREQFASSDVPFLLAVAAASCGGALLVFTLLFLLRGAHRNVANAWAVAALIVLLFDYHLVHAGLVDLFAMLGWSISENYAYIGLVVVVPAAAATLLRGRAAGQSFVAAAVALIAVPAIGLAHHALTAGPRTAQPASPSTLASQPLRKTPNVYYLMTDGYARQDQLARRLGFDNGPFVGYLRGRGFYVADAAYANYPMTYMSMPAALAMEYLVTETSARTADRSAFYAVIQGDNPVVGRLRANGYLYVHMGSGVWDGSRCSGREDLCLANSGELRAAFFRMTPLARFRRSESPTTAAGVERALDRLPRDRPVFLFAHVFAPHPPRTFNTDCTLRNVRSGSLFFWTEAGMADYVNDLGCTNRELASLLDRLLARDPDAIVVLHSDHGTAFGVDWRVPYQQWSRATFEERFAILMAVRLAPECAQLPYPALSPVNVFRIVFACLDGKPPERLADESFIATYEKHDQQQPAYRYPR